MGKILNWWNNLPLCKKKKQRWIQHRIHIENETNLLKEIRWPDNVFHTSLKDFTEDDWRYKEGDRCERYVAWFFKWITKRCTIVERTPEFIPMSTPTGIGGWNPDGYVTAYKVKDDDGNKIQTYIHQNDLSF